MSEELKVCDNCPMIMALEAAEKQINEKPSLHRTSSSRTAALTSILIAREVIGDIASRIKCPGPQAADSAFLVCPHQRTAGDVLNNIIGPNQQTKAVLDFEGTATESGQYL
ncbi:hypothetical protein HY441_00780 [Candidatus Microgenomates bacterium]|nr:hypothetical protein [Candidatus Microgenomates bacterium]